MECNGIIQFHSIHYILWESYINLPWGILKIQLAPPRFLNYICLIYLQTIFKISKLLLKKKNLSLPSSTPIPSSLTQILSLESLPHFCISSPSAPLPLSSSTSLSHRTHQVVNFNHHQQLSSSSSPSSLFLQLHSSSTRTRCSKKLVGAMLVVARKKTHSSIQNIYIIFQWFNYSANLHNVTQFSIEFL